jgi:serine/threonine protein kinase
MAHDPDHEDPIGVPDDDDSFLKPGGAFDGPLWQELLTEPAELDVGTHLGPYEIRAPIAAGGMGEVYRSFDTRLAREVAVKVLPRHSLDSPDAMTRFQREARAIAALNHPNILAIHDVGSEGDVHFAVTELLEGETLGTRLATGGPLVPSKAVEYAAEIAHGLAAAHERGIVHRDLKPANIFITNGGRVKILDFGIAVHFSPAAAENDQTVAGLTNTGLIVGTVGYMAPEQVLGHPATTRSDIFALGVVMYEMLTGTHPFRRSSAPETQTAILREDPPPLTSLVPGLPAPVARIVDLCLQKQARDRPESARDLALFLEASRHASSTWTPATAAPPTPALPQRLSTRLLAVVCALLVLLTAVTWAFVRVTANRSLVDAINIDFARAERAVRRVHREHLERLELTARLVASFPELKALLATDVATVADFLLGFQQRFPTAPLLVAIGADGVVVGRSEPPAVGGESKPDDWLSAINRADNDGSIIAVGSRPYLAVGVPSEAAGTIFGYIVAAESINQAYAEALSDATQGEVLLLSDDSMLASTLREGQRPWTSLKAWQAAGGRTDRFLDLEIGSQRYAAGEVSISGRPPVSVIVVKSREDAGAAYSAIERGVIIIGVTAIGIVALAGVWWSRRSKEA